jgi:competence protein ComEA
MSNRAPALCGLLLLALSLGAWGPRRQKPAPFAGCPDGLAAIEAEGQLRVRCVAQTLEEVAREGLASPAAGRSIQGRALARSGGGYRVRPLPLGVRRTLGLPIDLNVLSAEELAKLPGIGPKLARSIVVTRAKLGGFRNIEELRRVPGVGKAKLLTLRSHLTDKER